jgi:hypothetical protein
LLGDQFELAKLGALQIKGPEAPVEPFGVLETLTAGGHECC